jgi:peptide/nickel transport system substrate-binding protein
VARALALAAALLAALLPVDGAGGAEAQAPKRGGTVTVPGVFGGVREPGCLNPLRTCGDVALDHIAEVLEGAFEAGPDRLRPNLVTGVEFTQNPPFTLTYHIRPQARWSDGVPITASDFVFTHRTTRRADLAAGRDTAHTKVESIRAVSARVVQVVLRDRPSDWRRVLFTVVLPRHALLGQDFDQAWTDRIDNPKTGAPIGSGPFLVERWERGRQIVLRRNPRYWGPHAAYLDRLAIRFNIDDPVESLRTGALDVYQARLGLDPESARAFHRLPGVEHTFAAGARLEHFEVRIATGGHPALRSKLVRRALAYGIDRAALVRAIFGGIVPRIEPAQSMVFLPTSPHYAPNWRAYRYRPVLARRLLGKAGCRRGPDGTYVCGAERLSLRFVANLGVASRSRLVELVQAQLRRVGIEVVPSFAPNAILANQIIPSGKWDVWPIAFFYLPDQAVDLAFRCQGPANVTGYCQRLVTRELDQASRILDPNQYASALNRADRQMARDVPMLPLWQEPSLATYRSTLRGFVPTEPLVAWNAENWWLER